MRRLVFLSFLTVGIVLIPSGSGAAQEASDFLSVGEMAPDIQITGATRYGVVSEALTLSDLRGETVVLAFFFKVRTGG